MKNCAWELPRSKPPLFKNNLAVTLQFAVDQSDDIKGHRRTFLWTDERKVPFFAIDG